MRRFLWAGALARTGDYRLAKRIMSEILEEAGQAVFAGGQRERIGGFCGI